MSTQVSIQFDMPMMPATPGQQSRGTYARIPVQIRRNATAATRGTKSPPVITALVPLRDGAASLTLEPGSYYLRATLPNGDRLSETVEVTAGSAPQTITLQAPYNAPNEDSGWAYVLSEPRRQASQQADLLEKVSSADLGRRGSGKGSFSGGQVFEKMTHGPASFGMAPPARATAVAVLWNDSPTGWKPAGDARWTVDRRPFNDSDALERWQGVLNSMDRFWIEVLHAGHASKFALIPPSSQGQPTRILLKLDQIDHNDADPINIILESGNEAASVLSAYMHNGDADNARAVGASLLEQAQLLLEAKFTDFTSAVIAAYFMHQYGPSGSASPGWWPAWLRNLDVAFSTHSDGAIIRAWQFLNQEKHTEAAERFVEAARRGLPLFTRGVRMLLDGLELVIGLGNDHDDVRKAFVHVRQQAATLDWSEVTTTRWGVVKDSTFVPVRCGEAV